MAALCPHCGGELDTDVVLCPFCRNPVDEPPAMGRPAVTEKTIPCPGCGQVMGLLDPQCPVCLRPRSPREITRDIQAAKPLYRLRRTLLSPATAFFAVGLSILALAGYAWRRGWIKPPEPPPEPPREARPPLQEFSESGKPSARAPARRPKPSPFWRVRGRVYDLMTLQPVAGARLAFREVEGAKTYRAASTESGAYALRLPKLGSGGYAVSVAHPSYGKVFLEEASPPFHEQSLVRRREAREMLRSLRVLHVPLLPPRSQDSVEYNVILAKP